MSFGIDWVAGILRKFSLQQLICFKTGVHLEIVFFILRKVIETSCENYRQNPVSEQKSHARRFDDFSIFQTGCSTDDNLRSICDRNNGKCFQLQAIF